MDTPDVPFVIEEGCEVSGRISFSGEVIIEGIFRGSISCEKLVIRPRGKVYSRVNRGDQCIDTVKTKTLIVEEGSFLFVKVNMEASSVEMVRSVQTTTMAVAG